MKPKKRAPRLHPLHRRGEQPIHGVSCLVQPDVWLRTTMWILHGRRTCQRIRFAWFFATPFWDTLTWADQFESSWIFAIYFVETFDAKVASELGHALRLRGAEHLQSFMHPVVLLDSFQRCIHTWCKQKMCKILENKWDKYCTKL